MQYDVVVIGAGPGGYVAAIRAAQRGATVALVESGPLGGTCLNVGCVPTKTLIAGAEVLDHVRHAVEFGITITGAATADWPAMLARKNRIVESLRNGIGALLKSNSIDVFAGTGSFVSRREIDVANPNGSRTRLEARNVILASGSETVKPRFVPQAANILYSQQALELPALPASLLVLGGGVIGAEFACMFARLGVTVTLVEMLPEILPMVDADVARVVRGEMEKLGIKVLAGAKISDITSDGQTVTALANAEKLTAAALLVCVGRRPVTETLNIKAAGLATAENGRIPVDDRCRTAVSGIYAIGDIVGMVQYAHRASAMGICAANNATGLRDSYSDDGVPGCIFTVPEIGNIGLTEAQCREKGLNVKVGKYFFAGLGKALAIGETKGFAKIIADAGTDQILGVHIVGPHATDLIGEAAVAMRLECTATELGRAIHAHPTLAEALMECAHAVHNECIHAPARKRKS